MYYACRQRNPSFASANKRTLNNESSLDGRILRLNWVMRTQHSEHMLRRKNAASEFPNVSIFIFGFTENVNAQRKILITNPNSASMGFDEILMNDWHIARRAHNSFSRAVRQQSFTSVYVECNFLWLGAWLRASAFDELIFIRIRRGICGGGVFGAMMIPGFVKRNGCEH